MVRCGGVCRLSLEWDLPSPPRAPTATLWCYLSEVDNPLRGYYHRTLLACWSQVFASSRALWAPLLAALAVAVLSPALPSFAAALLCRCVGAWFVAALGFGGSHMITRTRSGPRVDHGPSRPLRAFGPPEWIFGITGQLLLLCLLLPAGRVDVRPFVGGLSRGLAALPLVAAALLCSNVGLVSRAERPLPLFCVCLGEANSSLRGQRSPCSRRLGFGALVACSVSWPRGSLWMVGGLWAFFLSLWGLLLLSCCLRRAALLVALSSVAASV